MPIDNVRIEELTKKALEQFGSGPEMLGLLPPCTKLVVTLTFVRGHSSVQAGTKYDVREQRGAHLTDNQRLTQEDWESILDLPEFARSPESMTSREKRMMATLREFKKRGRISQVKVSFPVIPRLNEVLKRHNAPYRVISFKHKNEGYHFKVTRII